MFNLTFRKMRTKKLNSELFSKMEMNNADMSEVKGGYERIFSGSGRTGDGYACTEYCIAYDNGSVGYEYHLM